MPLKNQLHVSKLLENASVQYRNEEYVWDKVFPKLMVSKDVDLYRVYDRNFKIPESKRAPKGVAREFGFEFSTSSYSLEQHALKDYVGVDEESENDIGSIEIDTVENLTDAIHRRMEDSLAALFTTTSWSLNVSLAAANAFNQNTTVSDPIPVFDTGASTIIANSGKTPTFAVVPRDAMIAMKNHVSVLDRVKYTSGEVSQEILKGLIGMQEMLVPTAVKDTAAEGVAASMSSFFGDAVFMGWKPGSPGMKTPSCGYAFMKNAPQVRKWKDEERNANAVEVEIKYQFKVVASLCGYLIKDVI